MKMHNMEKRYIEGYIETRAAINKFYIANGPGRPMYPVKEGQYIEIKDESIRGDEWISGKLRREEKTVQDYTDQNKTIKISAWYIDGQTGSIEIKNGIPGRILNP